jgi:hypothetical protein
MDPESLKEFEGRHAKMTGIQQSLASGDFKSGYVMRVVLIGSAF